MNCETLNTAAQILEAFRACKNAGEEIDLFECLATRPDPPVSAFVEILQKIKLEPVLALTLQAFGKITDADVKQRLKQSDDLLIMLSEQARSGSTDLIRWAGATTIDKLGFDFIAVSQHLSEEPRSIAEKIMQSKIKRFADQNLIESNDYDEFLRFWTYGYWYKLKELTLGYEFWTLKKEWESKRERGWQDSHDVQEIQRLNKFSVCWEVMQSLSLRGLNEVNLALQKAEEYGESASEIDENEVFEGIAQVLSEKQIDDLNNLEEVNKILINTQLHCLESNNKLTRQVAAQQLYDFGNLFLENIKEQKVKWFYLTMIIYELGNKSINNITYRNLEILSRYLETLEKELKRKKVRREFQEIKVTVLNEIRNRQSIFDAAKTASQNLRESIQLEINDNLSKIQSISSEIYYEIYEKVQLETLPKLSVNNDNSLELFKKFQESLRNKLSIASSAQEQVSKFYTKMQSCIELYHTIETQINNLKNYNYQLYEKINLEFHSEKVPDLNSNNYTQYDLLLYQYQENLKMNTEKLRVEIGNFYVELLKTQLLEIDLEIIKAEKALEEVSVIKKYPHLRFKILITYLLLFLLSLALFPYLSLFVFVLIPIYGYLLLKENNLGKHNYISLMTAKISVKRCFWINLKQKKLLV